MNSGNTVGFTAVLENGFDLKAQDFPFIHSLGFRSSLPFVVPAFADLEHSEHDLEIEFFAMLVNEFESHLLSLAKRPRPSGASRGQEERHGFF